MDQDKATVCVCARVEMTASLPDSGAEQWRENSAFFRLFSLVKEKGPKRAIADSPPGSRMKVGLSAAYFRPIKRDVFSQMICVRVRSTTCSDNTSLIGVKICSCQCYSKGFRRYSTGAVSPREHEVICGDALGKRMINYLVTNSEHDGSLRGQGQVMKMSVEVRGPLVSRPVAFANEEKKVVHSWSRVSSAGHDVILDALHILSPKSRDLSSTDDLLSFLQELRDEGHRPTILRSKDVYRYRSCMTLPLTEDMLRQANKNARPAAKKKRKKPHKKRDVHPSWSNEKSRPRIQGVRPPEPRLNPRPVFVFSRIRAQETPVQPCLRLINIEGQTGYHTARLQVQPTFNPSHKPAAGLPPMSPVPPPSGLPSQPLQNGVVALFSQKSQSCPASRSDGALIGDSAPVFDSQTHAELHTRSNQYTRSNGMHPSRRSPNETRNGWKERDRRSFRAKVVKVDESRSVTEARLKAQKILQVNLSPVIKIQPFHRILRDFRYQIK
ncbi:hypothetical protein WMY93_020295 [Mugilogobius chulae]|uniref:Uncharacterized protein n=1 Tax=Mugilogobius chulae TaxID=88201 RepID=A0AAW0NRM2_9GOBI